MGQPLTTDNGRYEVEKMRSCSNAIYGSRIKGTYPSRASGRTVARRRFIPIGDGRNRRTLIYDRDVAKAALLATQHPKAAGKVYNVSDSHFHTLKEIIVAICNALGRNPPRLSLPVGTVRLATGILEDAGRMIGFKSPISRETIDKYTEDIAVDGSLIRKELGFMPEYDLNAGWREVLFEEDDGRRTTDDRRPRRPAAGQVATWLPTWRTPDREEGRRTTDR